jgi:hypothetical protein
MAGRRAGTGYVTKPVDVGQLLDCMQRWLPPAAGPAQ